MIEIKTIGKKKQGSNNTTKSYGGGFASTVNIKQEVKEVNIWGQPHDHKGDVDGDLTANGNITASGNITATDGQFNGEISAANANISGTINGDDLVLGGDISCIDIDCANVYASNSITTEYLTVTKNAHFFNLTIDEIKSVGGQIILSAANATIDYVTTTNGHYLLAWKYEDGDKGIRNQFRVNDQIICQTFNQTATNGVNVENKYYWAVVTMVGAGTYIIDGESVDCHYIVLDNTQSGFDGQSVPAVGDKICQLGYRGTDDNGRQSAIILSAYQSIDPNVTAPSIAQYTGINSFSLDGCIVNQMSPTENLFTGEFRVINNGSTTDIIDLISGQNPQVITDSQQSWIMADSSGKTYYLTDYQNLPTTIKAYLGSDLIPYSEWITGSQIKYGNTTYRLTGTAPALAPRTGLYVSSITRNTNDVTLGWGYLANEVTDPQTQQTTNNGTSVSNSNIEITIKFTHNNTTYTISKNVPINVIKASAVTQGADAEFDKLMIDALDLTVTLDNKLTCNVNAKVFHIKGADIAQVTDLTDYTCQLVLSNNDAYTLSKSTYFYRTTDISNSYSTMTNPPTSATLKLMKNGTLMDEFVTTIKFNAGSIFTITDNAITSAVQQANTYTDGEITSVNADISTLTQTANSISSRVTSIENDYVTSSELTQTANNIQLNVYDELLNKTGIDVSAGQITLNGNTVVNGNLTISDAEQGFTLVGDGGITQIMPKSIGTYNQFTALTTTNIVKEDMIYCNFLNGSGGYFNYRVNYSFIVGNIKSGSTITVTTPVNNYYVAGIAVNPNDIQVSSCTIAIYEDGVQMAQGSIAGGSYSYTAQGGNISVNILEYVGIDTDVFWNHSSDSTRVYKEARINVSIPNDKFILIGYDGIGMNFGRNKNVYIGEESTTLKYGQHALRIDATDGVQIHNGTRWYSLDEYITMIAG